MFINKRDGTTEIVLLAPLPNLLLVDYILHDLDGDESKLVELIADRPFGWADTLTPESIEQLLAAADAMNRDRVAQAGISMAEVIERRQDALEVAVVKAKRALAELTS